MIQVGLGPGASDGGLLSVGWGCLREGTDLGAKLENWKKGLGWFVGPWY